MTVLPFPYESFAGGLNTKDSAFLLQDNQSRDLQNVQGTTSGAIVKRNGLVTLASTPSMFTSLAPIEAAPTPFLIGAAGTSLYSVTPGGTVTAIKTGLTSGLRWEWVQTQSVVAPGTFGPAYGMNGVDTPQTWTGATAGTSTVNWTASTGSVPNGKYMVLAGNRIWVTGVPATPSRVFFSDLIPTNNGPVNWPAANVSVFDENDGEPITGLGLAGPYILVTKARKLFIIYNMNTGDARRLSDSIGCIAHRSIDQGPEGTYFLGEDRGVYLTNGSKVTPISDVIQPTIDSVAPGQRSTAAGTCFNGHYYLSVNRGSPAGQNDTVLDWDETLKSWWLHSFGSNQFAAWHSSVGASPGLYSAKGTGAIVDQCFVPNTLTDNGTPFMWRWRGPWQSPSFYRRRRFPTPYFRKRLRQVRIAGSGTVDLSFATDFAGDDTLRQANIYSGGVSGTWGDSNLWGGAAGTWGDTPVTRLARFFSFGVANAFSMVFSATSSTTDTITEYTLFIADRRDQVNV